MWKVKRPELLDEVLGEIDRKREVVPGIDEERALAEKHLDGCAYCRKRYRFEAQLRRFVRQAATEPMSPELKTKLAELRTPLI